MNVYQEKLAAWKAKYMAWWSELAVREQRAVSIGGVVVGLFILYAGIWSPILAHLDQMRKQIQIQQKNLVWMQNADKEMQQFAAESPHTVKAMTSLQLISLLQKKIKQAGLESTLTGLKQTQADAVEAHFQKVEFDKLISMLTVIVREHHVAITRMSATADTTPGLVSADVVVMVH